jgi:two-component system, LytTR family, response regulator
MTTILRAIVVDDEPVARELLAAMLAEAETEVPVEVVAECGNARDGIEAIREHAPDMVFLDIQMPDGDGFSVIEAIGTENMPPIIFVTAYDQYALRAFDVVAVDYLLKPFDEERLGRTLRRVQARVHRPAGETEQRLIALLDEMRGHRTYASRLAVDAERHLTFVPTSEIVWIEAKGRHSLVHTAKASFLMREGISNIEERLDPAEFVRIHRSYAVRLDQVREVHRWFRGDYHIVLKDGTKLTSGGSYKKLIEDTLLGSQRPSG